MLKWLFGKRGEDPVETRSSGANYTAQLIGARASYIAGVSGTAELTSAVQSCVSLWEHGLAAADVDGTQMFTRRHRAMAARALALRGEAVFVIRDDRMIAASDWEVTTRDGVPRAYRLSIPDVGGGRTMTALAPEVVHFVTGADATAPWAGIAPLRRARLSGELLAAIETALSEIYRDAPLASLVIPMPESREDDLSVTAGSFVGRRGRVLLRESVHVSAAGGPAPSHDWRPADLTADVNKIAPREMLEASRNAVAMAFGVLPIAFHHAAMGPAIREVQRHLAGWTLQPIAALMAEELEEKLGAPVKIDVMRATQAYDVSAKARAVSTYLEALATARQNGLLPGEVQEALSRVAWEE